MIILEYRKSIFVGLIAFILLNIAFIAGFYFNETKSSFLELTYFLTMMIGLIFFITAIFLAMIKNKELNQE